MEAMTLNGFTTDGLFIAAFLGQQGALRQIPTPNFAFFRSFLMLNRADGEAIPGR
jgi:hypothetical protein